MTRQIPGLLFAFLRAPGGDDHIGDGFGVVIADGVGLGI